MGCILGNKLKDGMDAVQFVSFCKKCSESGALTATCKAEGTVLMAK